MLEYTFYERTGFWRAVMPNPMTVPLPDLEPGFPVLDKVHGLAVCTSAYRNGARKKGAGIASP